MGLAASPSPPTPPRADRLDFVVCYRSEDGGPTDWMRLVRATRRQSAGGRQLPERSLRGLTPPVADRDVPLTRRPSLTPAQNSPPTLSHSASPREDGDTGTVRSVRASARAVSRTHFPRGESP